MEFPLQQLIIGIAAFLISLVQRLPVFREVPNPDRPVIRCWH